MRYVVSPVVRLLTPSVCYGVERVPLSGGAVIAANHLSAIDHPLLGQHCPRSIYFIAKQELLAIPLVGEVLAWTGVFPVRRGEADRDALRRGRELVRAGKAVGVHLEGTRQRFGHPGVFKGGGLLIALGENVPVVPAGIESFGWSPANRRPCVVVWGEPIDLAQLPRGRRGIDAAIGLVGPEIVRLWRQACEAIAGGLPPALPDGTRRTGAIRPRAAPARSSRS
jgi:1-acyl-sn-glycerol-3-phosphate acyltransferase